MKAFNAYLLIFIVLTYWLTVYLSNIITSIGLKDRSLESPYTILKKAYIIHAMARVIRPLCLILRHVKEDCTFSGN